MSGPSSSTAAARTRALARLAVELGANVAPGQDVVVLAYDVEHASVAREIADAAYQVGAHDVTVLYWDQHVKRSRLLHAEEDSLDYTPEWWDHHIEAQDWGVHVARLRARAEALNARGFEALRFRGPGTDLTLGLLGGAVWIAAGFETSWGREMIANMPTEEVFTTPDKHVAEGTVAATRPFQLVGGPIVEGLRLRFAGGRVVEVEADVGADAVRARLEQDAGAARLGEVALVDGTSPIGQSGLVFNDILFDENATCHIALATAIRSRCRTCPRTGAAGRSAASTCRASTRTC